MFSIRRFEFEDVPQMQQINLECLPENYSLKYWNTHMVQWPECTYVATYDGKVVAYVMGKIEDNHGHLTSVAVKQEYRGLGLATQLLRQVHMSMRDVHKVKSCTLHVRQYNEVAQRLYGVNNAYYHREKDVAYFADGENAYKMRCDFEHIDSFGIPIPEFQHLINQPLIEPNTEDK